MDYLKENIIEESVGNDTKKPRGKKSEFKGEKMVEVKYVIKDQINIIT